MSVYRTIGPLVCFARASCSINDTNSRGKFFTAKQTKAIGIINSSIFHFYQNTVGWYGGVVLLQQDFSGPEFYGDLVCVFKEDRWEP